MARTKPWEVSDDLWERVRPLIPPRPPHPKGGRPAADDRQMFAAIVYLLRTGIPWNAMPRDLGASCTVYAGEGGVRAVVAMFFHLFFSGASKYSIDGRLSGSAETSHRKNR